MGVAGGFLLLGAAIVGLVALASKAGAATAPSSSPAGQAGAGSSPLPGVTRWERTDQGVDAVAAPGSAVRSIYAGRVSAIIPNWYAGQPAVFIDSAGLPGGATGIYYAEQLSPNVQVGDQVNAGQQIGTVAQAGTGLEIGLAHGASTLAQATGGYVEGQITQAGLLMRQLLQSLGIKGV